jgi:hypothetical protein
MKDILCKIFERSPNNITLTINQIKLKNARETYANLVVARSILYSLGSNTKHMYDDALRHQILLIKTLELNK